LREETELLLAAREEVHAGRCMSAVDRMERARARIHEGALLQEREVLAIEALACVQRESEASTRAAAFLREHPESPYAESVRRFLHEPPDLL
jgi:hypothetical protein